MSETIYGIGYFPGHALLKEILDSGPMPDPNIKQGVMRQPDPLEKYLVMVQQILKDRGYPTTSMELDTLIIRDIDSGKQPDDLMMAFTMLLRLAHTTRAVFFEGDICRFGYYMGQLSKVTTEAKFFETHTHTISGLKSYEGAQKSRLKRAALKEPRPSHLEIINYGRTLLALGYERHNLVGMAHQKFASRNGFPISKRQYSTILKPLINKENNKDKEKGNT